ncbi:hypothetical protein [Nonomuraea sp. NPDC049695]|uniref:hypothetical protein n=1 Tax=Nonomuraea sp. NPDC049695 TaxID=3154734 RepID=UPI00342F3647
MTGLAVLTPPADAWLGLHTVVAAGLLLVEVAVAATVVGTALFGGHEHSERAFRLLR